MFTTDSCPCANQPMNTSVKTRYPVRKRARRAGVATSHFGRASTSASTARAVASSASSHARERQMPCQPVVSDSGSVNWPAGNV